MVASTPSYPGERQQDLMRKVTESPWLEQKRSREEVSSKKRDAVLATAARLFQEKGFENCTLNDIADALHVSKPTIYYYGKSKELILLEILNFATGSIVTAFQRAARLDASGIEKLRIAVRDYAEVRVSDPGRCATLVRESMLGPAGRAELANKARLTKKYAFEIFDSGFADGTLREVDRLTLYNTLFGALNWLPHWMAEAKDLSLQDIVDRQIDLFTNGVGLAVAPRAVTAPAKRKRAPARKDA